MIEMTTCMFCRCFDDPGLFKPFHGCHLASDGAACQPCLAMQEIESEIAAVKDKLYKLFERHRKARVQMNDLHDPMSARLPVEIIFQTCIPTELFSASPYMEEQPQANRRLLATPFTLGAVCRNWRDIAWSTPGVWNFIDINADRVGKRVELQDLAMEWLSRSGNLPLSLKVHSSSKTFSPRTSLGVRALSEGLNKLSPRWQTLDLTLPRGCLSLFQGTYGTPSILQSLRLETKGLSEGDSGFEMANASPRELRLCGDFSFNSIAVGFNRLTHIQVFRIGLKECVEMAKHAQLLESFAIVGTKQPDEDDSSFSGKVVTLPCLRRLRICDRIGVSPLLTCISCPALETLTFENVQYGRLGLATLSFLIHSSCHLQQLFFLETPINDSDMISLLKGIPSLRHLHVSPCFWVWKEENLLERLTETVISDENVEEGQFLPLLNSFTYLINRPWHWTWNKLFAEVEKLFGMRQRSLKFIQLYIEGWSANDAPLSYIDVDVLDHIHNLWEAGMKLAIFTEIEDVDIIKTSTNYHYSRQSQTSSESIIQRSSGHKDSAVL